MKILGIIFLFFILAHKPSFGHDFYLGIAQIEYNEKTKKFEVAIKLTTHDLEYAIEKGGASPLKLGSKKENIKADEYIKAYVLKHFGLKADDKNVFFHMIGKEVSLDEEIWIYLESDPVKSPKLIEVKNSLLADYFEAQQNHIHLKYKTKTYAIVMMKGTYEGTIYSIKKKEK